MRHHDEAVARYLARTAARPEVLGVLLTGSLATRSEREDSDVDLVLVVTDETWRRAAERDRIMFVEHDGAGYPGGYFDVKLATLDQLEAAAERGDDPVRHSLGTAEVLYDQGFDLASMLARVAGGAGGHRREDVASFVAQARIHGEYFLEQGVARDDGFLAAHAAVHLGLAAGRALLADSGVRHPGPKDLLTTVGSLTDPGPRFAAAIGNVARAPSSAAARVLLDLVELHLGHALPERATLSRFVTDNELAWYRRIVPPEHR